MVEVINEIMIELFGFAFMVKSMKTIFPFWNVAVIHNFAVDFCHKIHCSIFILLEGEFEDWGVIGNGESCVSSTDLSSLNFSSCLASILACWDLSPLNFSSCWTKSF